METKSLVQTAVAVLVAVVVFSTVLIPIVNDQTYDRTTYENKQVEFESGYTLTDNEEDFLITFTADNSAILSINGGNPINLTSQAREQYLVCSDKFAAIQKYLGSSATAPAYYFNIGDSYSTNRLNFAVGDTISYTAETKTLVITTTGTQTSFVLEWQYHICGSGGEYRTMQTSVPWYCATDGLKVAGGGSYTTGDNDTSYSYYFFNSIKNDTNARYDVEIIPTYTPINEGISQATVKLDIGGEEFTPWNVIVPISVTSTNYTGMEILIQTIPILVIVGLILSVIGSVVIRRFDE